MDGFTQLVGLINSYAWGWPMLALILGTGLFLQIGLRLMPIRHIGSAFKQLWQGRKTTDQPGNISPFNSLMTSLAATIGTGNIAGVATAIVLGGPGALFWMWITALVGMATKYAEAVCAVQFRERDEQGEYRGGPMYYIKNGLGNKWLWLATAFAGFAMVAGFGIGNTVQANSVAQTLHATFAIPTWLTGLILMVLVASVLLGGIRWIATTAGYLVPFMAIAYVLAGLIVILLNITALPATLWLIVESAFTGHAAAGGFAGATVLMAIRWGVARGIFSNEAGLGSAPIAHACARTNSPVRQGTIAMLGTFIDTLIICSITGIAIIITGVWSSGETGAALTASAFGQTLSWSVLEHNLGQLIVSCGLAIFAFTTILGWSVYGERCTQYLFGQSSSRWFRLLWVVLIPVGATADLGIIWLIADTLNAFMALPNLIALALLSPVVFKLTRQHFDERLHDPRPTTTD